LLFLVTFFLPDLLLPVGVFGRPCYCLHTSAHCASLLSLLTHARTRPRSLTRHTHLWDDSPFSESEYTPIHGEYKTGLAGGAQQQVSAREPLPASKQGNVHYILIHTYIPLAPFKNLTTAPFSPPHLLSSSTLSCRAPFPAAQSSPDVILDRGMCARGPIQTLCVRLVCASCVCVDRRQTPP